ncbi:host attachment protein [Bdellovibrio sp. HCB337]|uniref:host attachment protein n=1 Tax=Bdellovibrio sp. HCB337 TaxID=3394358 RepID=UPI0039A51664
MKTWVAVVNRCEARLFELDDHRKKNAGGRLNNKLKLVKKLENPRGRLRNGEIDADRPGFSKSSFSYSGTRLAKSQEPTERVAEMFAKSISEELERAIVDHQYDDLILVVEPHFLGKVRAELSKKTSGAISTTLHKDLVNVPDHQLQDFIWPKTHEEEVQINL